MPGRSGGLGVPASPAEASRQREPAGWRGAAQGQSGRPGPGTPGTSAGPGTRQVWRLLVSGTGGGPGPGSQGPGAKGAKSGLRGKHPHPMVSSSRLSHSPLPPPYPPGLALSPTFSMRAHSSRPLPLPGQPDPCLLGVGAPSHPWPSPSGAPAGHGEQRAHPRAAGGKGVQPSTRCGAPSEAWSGRELTPQLLAPSPSSSLSSAEPAPSHLPLLPGLTTPGGGPRGCGSPRTGPARLREESSRERDSRGAGRTPRPPRAAPSRASPVTPAWRLRTHLGGRRAGVCGGVCGGRERPLWGLSLHPSRCPL